MRPIVQAIPSDTGKIKEVLLASSSFHTKDEIKAIFLDRYLVFDSDVHVLICTGIKALNGQRITKSSMQGSWQQMLETLEDQFKSQWRQAHPEKGKQGKAPRIIWLPILVDLEEMYRPIAEAIRKQIDPTGQITVKYNLKYPFSVSPWTQDPFLVGRGPCGDPVLIEPWYFPKFGDRIIADIVAEGMGYFLQPTRFDFEGGNVLAGTDELFIGMDSLLRNYRREGAQGDFDSFKQEQENLLQQTLGVSQVYWIGKEDPGRFPSHQAFFHLDLYLSLAGRLPTGQKLLIVGQIKEDTVLWATNCADRKFSALQAHAEALDDTARRLAKAGYHVERMPLGILAQCEEGNTKLLPLSFQNGLVECHAGQKRTWLPRYKFRKRDYIDGANRYQSLIEAAINQAKQCFDTVEFSPYHFDPIAKGALHCVVKVLRRE